MGSWKQPEDLIKKVVQPFNLQINRQQIQVFIGRNKKFDFELKMDWNKYQLILFNIIQNAVKYNNKNGVILIELNCLPLREEEENKSSLIEEGPKKMQDFLGQEQVDGLKYILETTVIDTGIGIIPERQKMLFIPFLELKIKQNMKKVKDHTIGMGLACSKEICNNLGGDIMLASSEPGLTQFSFKLPVIAKICLKDSV